MQTYDPTSKKLSGNQQDGDSTIGATQLLFTCLDVNFEEKIAVHVLVNTGTNRLT